MTRYLVTEVHAGGDEQVGEFVTEPEALDAAKRIARQGRAVRVELVVDGEAPRVVHSTSNANG